jgi:PDZ domain-containing protein
MRRRWIGWLGLIVGVLALAAVLWFTPTNDYVILPGVTGNLNRMVWVKGGRVPRHGRMLMVAVDLAPANLFLDLYGRVSPTAEVVPGADLVPTGGSLSQYLRESAMEMAESHQDAEVAALSLLGYPARVTGDGAVVYDTLKGTPAAGRLRAGDLIVAVNGTPVHTAGDLLAAMRHVKVGGLVHLAVLRHGLRLGYLLRTVPNPQVPGAPMVGVAIGTDHQRYVIPIQVRIRSGDISGPSAGLMFSLQIINELRPGWDLTHGMTVAGTGEIDPYGGVHEIGGVREKVVTVYRAGAKVFLVPTGNYRDALAEEKTLGIEGRLRLIPVANLAQAVHALRTL